MFYYLKIAIFLFVALLSLPATVFAQAANPPEAVFKNDYPAGTPRIKAACLLLPIQFLIDRIGGELTDSLALIPAGFDPHTFEPKSSHLAALNQADVYFSTNTPLEDAWIERLTSVNPRIRIIDLAKPLMHTFLETGENVLSPDGGSVNGTVAGNANATATGTVLEQAAPTATANTPDQASNFAVEHLDSEYPHYDGHDPHIWMSPDLLVQICEIIRSGLSVQMPNQAPYFEKNCRALIAQIKNTDQYVKSLLADLPENKRSFLVFHPSWKYFADDYGLTQMAVEQEGREPTPVYLAMVIQEARSKGVSVIFVQKEINPDVAAMVAAQLPGGKTLVLDPLGYNPLKSIRESAEAISGQADQTDEANAGVAAPPGEDGGMANSGAELSHVESSQP